MNEVLVDFLDLVRRRGALILGIVVFGFAGSLYFGLGQRPVYQSVETLHIASPRIAPELLPTTVNEPLEGQLRGLVRYLLSDPMLDEIVTAYGLFADAPHMSQQAKTDALSDAIAVDWARPGDGEPVHVMIKTRLDTAEDSRLVAQELGHRLIKLSVQRRIAQANQTLDFLIEAEQSQQADLWALQARYAAFRRNHSDLLEGGDSLRQSEMDSLSRALVTIEREKIALEQKIAQTPSEAAQAWMEVQLETLMRQRESLEIQRATLAQDMVAPSGFRAEMRGYERELERIREELAEASARRTQAEVGLNIERERQSERLVVTEPATLPIKPVVDTRGTLVALGGAISVLLALIIALILDMRHPVMRTAGQMKRQTGITPIAVIPFRPRDSFYSHLGEESSRAAP
ncbi:MAG: hypothetical protein AB3N11_01215 [Arenibacterium sp.]